MAGNRSVGQDPGDPIAWLTCNVAVRAVAIGVEDLAENMGPVIGADRSPGDRDAQLDGSADRVSNIGSKLSHGSCGVRRGCVGTSMITPRARLHVVVAHARPEPHLRTLRYEEPTKRAQ